MSRNLRFSATDFYSSFYRPGSLLGIYLVCFKGQETIPFAVLLGLAFTKMRKMTASLLQFGLAYQAESFSQ